MNKIEQYIELKNNYETNITLSKTALEDATSTINIMHESNYIVDLDVFKDFVQQYYVVIGTVCRYHNQAIVLLKDLIQEPNVGYIDSETEKNINIIRKAFNEKQEICEQELERLKELVANFSNDYKIEKRPVLNTCDSQKTFLDEYLTKIRDIGRQEFKIDGIFYDMEKLIEKKQACQSHNFKEKLPNIDDVCPEN